MHVFFHKPPKVGTVSDLVRNMKTYRRHEEENLGNGDLVVSLIHHHVLRRQTGAGICNCCMGRRLLGAGRNTWKYI